MRVQVIGTGIVGEATACLARDLCHEVYGYDIKSNRSQYYTTGLVQDADIVFICVNEDAVPEVVKELRQRQVGGLYVVRSTTRPGTTSMLSETYGIHICHNPEFLREASYLADAIKPPFILIGYCCERHLELILAFYNDLDPAIKRLSVPTQYSEASKLFLNNYLACLITFWCEVKNISDRLGLDASTIAAIISNDPRVSKYGFTPIGKGLSGRCLPKDLRQMIEFGKEMDITPKLLEAIEEYNYILRGRKQST